MGKQKEIKERRDKIIRGLELAYEKMIEFKKSKNTPLVVSKNGKVVEIDPHEAPQKVSYTS